MISNAISTNATPSKIPPAPFITSPLLCRKEAAKYLNVSTQTLAQWACNGRVAIPFVKLGRKVLYRKTDLDKFIQENLQLLSFDSMAHAC